MLLHFARLPVTMNEKRAILLRNQLAMLTEELIYKSF